MGLQTTNTTTLLHFLFVYPILHLLLLLRAARTLLASLPLPPPHLLVVAGEMRLRRSGSAATATP